MNNEEKIAKMLVELVGDSIIKTQQINSLIELLLDKEIISAKEYHDYQRNEIENELRHYKLIGDMKEIFNIDIAQNIEDEIKKNKNNDKSS